MIWSPSISDIFTINSITKGTHRALHQHRQSIQLSPSVQVSSINDLHQYKVSQSGHLLQHPADQSVYLDQYQTWSISLSPSCSGRYISVSPLKIGGQSIYLHQYQAGHAAHHQQHHVGWYLSSWSYIGRGRGRSHFVKRGGRRRSLLFLQPAFINICF